MNTMKHEGFEGINIFDKEKLPEFKLSYLVYLGIVLILIAGMINLNNQIKLEKEKSKVVENDKSEYKTLLIDSINHIKKLEPLAGISLNSFWTTYNLRKNELSQKEAEFWKQKYNDNYFKLLEQMNDKDINKSINDYLECMNTLKSYVYQDVNSEVTNATLKECMEKEYNLSVIIYKKNKDLNYLLPFSKTFEDKNFMVD